jgi:hypothetical protein
VPTKDWLELYGKNENLNGALLLGDRDPTYGQQSYRGTFRHTEKFDRSDDPNLGDAWYIIQQTLAGWNIVSEVARCSDVGWERWSAYPYCRDVSVFGDVRISQNDSRVGLFSRLNWKSASDGLAWGYLGSLYVNGAGTAYLQIEHMFASGGVQNRNVLVQKSISYTLDTVITLEFETVGSQLTLYARSGETLIDSCTISDSTFLHPGAFGLCGETPGSTDYVYADNIRAETRAGIKTSITE